MFKYSIAYPQNLLLNSGFHRYRTEMATVVYSIGNPVCHVTGLLVFIGQSGLMQSDFTFGLNAGNPSSLFYYLHPESSGHVDAVAIRIAVSQMILWVHKGILKCFLCRFEA